MKNILSTTAVQLIIILLAFCKCEASASTANTHEHSPKEGEEHVRILPLAKSWVGQGPSAVAGDPHPGLSPSSEHRSI